MEKVKRKEGRVIDWVALILDKQDEIVEFINELERERKKEKADHLRMHRCENMRIY